MDIHRLALLALPLSASLLAACGEAKPPATVREHRTRSFHAVAWGTEPGRPIGLAASADLVPDAPTDETWGAGLRPGRSASGISP